MSKTWNLAPAQWSQVLLDGVDVDRVAETLQGPQVCSWTAVLLEQTKRSTTILDLGSGRGQHSAALALAGKDTTLLDWSTDNVAFSRRLFDSLNLSGRFCRADILKPLPFRDNTFDTVFSCGVFEYFTDDEIVSVLREAFRVATKDVIIMVPNAWSIAYRVGKFYQEAMGTWNWGGERPLATLKPHFRNAGCNAVKELSVAAKTSLEFLTMRGGRIIQNALTDLLKLRDDPKPAWLRQGYLLVSTGQKSA